MDRLLVQNICIWMITWWIFLVGDCRAIVSYELSRDELLFKMVGKSDGYVAVGLSPGNNLMGGDLTTACYYNQNNGEVRTWIMIASDNRQWKSVFEIEWLYKKTRFLNVFKIYIILYTLLNRHFNILEIRRKKWLFKSNFCVTFRGSIVSNFNYLVIL